MLRGRIAGEAGGERARELAVRGGLVGWASGGGLAGWQAFRSFWSFRVAKLWRVCDQSERVASTEGEIRRQVNRETTGKLNKTESVKNMDVCRERERERAEGRK